MKLNSLIRVSNAGVFNESPEDHEEADEEIDVNRLHVGDLGQRRVDGVAESRHGEDRGHS